MIICTLNNILYIIHVETLSGRFTNLDVSMTLGIILLRCIQFCFSCVGGGRVITFIVTSKAVTFYSSVSMSWLHHGTRSRFLLLKYWAEMIHMPPNLGGLLELERLKPRMCRSKAGCLLSVLGFKVSPSLAADLELGVD